MNYSIDYENYSEDIGARWDDGALWENLYEQAQNHAERLMADLVKSLARAVETNDWHWYKHDLQTLNDISKMLEVGNMFGYGARFIGEPLDYETDHEV